MQFSSAGLDLPADVTYYFRAQFCPLLSLISFSWLGSITLAYIFLVIFHYTKSIKNCGMTCLYQLCQHFKKIANSIVVSDVFENYTFTTSS
jgi:hypothetical protein